MLAAQDRYPKILSLPSVSQLKILFDGMDSTIARKTVAKNLFENRDQ